MKQKFKRWIPFQLKSKTNDFEIKSLKLGIFSFFFTVIICLSSLSLSFGSSQKRQGCPDSFNNKTQGIPDPSGEENPRIPSHETSPRLGIGERTPSNADPASPGFSQDPFYSDYSDDPFTTGI